MVLDHRVYTLCQYSASASGHFTAVWEDGAASLKILALWRQYLTDPGHQFDSLFPTGVMFKVSFRIRQWVSWGVHRNFTIGVLLSSPFSYINLSGCCENPSNLHASLSPREWKPWESAFRKQWYSVPKLKQAYARIDTVNVRRFLRFAGRGCEHVVVCFMTVEEEGRSQRTHFGYTLGTYRNTLSEDARNIAKETQWNVFAGWVLKYKG